jgi:hypothetical protein
MRFRSFVVYGLKNTLFCVLRHAGFSLMLVGPTDRANFIKLLRLPGKGNKVFVL